MIRRAFLKGLGALGLAGPAGLAARAGAPTPTAGGVPVPGVGAAGAGPGGAGAGSQPSRAEEREYWVAMLSRVAGPVLERLAEGRLRAGMPVEVKPGVEVEDRARFTHLEAFGRTMAGLAPWLELGPDDSAEGRTRARFTELSHAALARAVDPGSPDFMNFTDGRQPLVDAAFLAHTILRAPRVLRDDLDASTRRRLVEALVATRAITPYYSNWLLFSAMVEAALLRLGEDWDPVRVDLTVRKLSEWYLGDGIYGDGPELHWDYYNSYVIQPFLLDILQTVGDRDSTYAALRNRQVAISRRYGEIQERLIAPDGSFPPIGRSLVYRCGAFQLLAQLALQGLLPDSLPPAQVRAALGAVIRRTLEPADTFDPQGWLRLGLAGSQPDLAEGYISTGSLYLCTTAFLPLGLPTSDPFWADPAVPWTSVRVWTGESLPADHALQIENR
jgi:hypothetical protein